MDKLIDIKFDNPSPDTSTTSTTIDRSPFPLPLDDEITPPRDVRNVYQIGDIKINILNTGQIHPQCDDYQLLLLRHGLNSAVNIPTCLGYNENDRIYKYSSTWLTSLNT